MIIIIINNYNNNYISNINSNNIEKKMRCLYLIGKRAHSFFYCKF